MVECIYIFSCFHSPFVFNFNWIIIVVHAACIDIILFMVKCYQMKDIAETDVILSNSSSFYLW